MEANSQERSTRIGKAVVITLPVALLTRKAYLVTLSGAAAGDNYENWLLLFRYHKESNLSLSSDQVQSRDGAIPTSNPA